VLARVFEEHGLATTLIGLIAPPVFRVKPPRALIVPFPYGYALGKANDAPFQHRVLGAALELLQENDTPVVREFAEELDRPARIHQESGLDTTSPYGPASGRR
jgi:hypothetical protein